MTTSKTGVVLSLLVFIACGRAWRRIEPAGAGFSMEMPANVDCVEKDWRHRTADYTWVGRTCGAEAEPLISFLPASTGTYIVYSIAWVVVPPELEKAKPEEVLAAFEAPEVKSRSAIIAEAQRFWETEGKEKYGGEFRSIPSLLGGEPAIDRYFLPTGTASVKGFVGRNRVALCRGRLYTVSISGLRGARLEEVWARMIESFAFTGKPAT